MVRSLFANPVNLKRHVLETIRNDATIGEDIRQKSLALAERFHLDEIVDAKAWYYTTNDGDRVFVKTRDGWVERGTSGTRYDFAEVSRTADIVELLDRSRNLSVRLHNDHMEWSTNKQDWHLSHQGEWR